MKKRMLVIAAAVTATMMMTCPVMADDFKVGICNYVDDASLNQIVDNIEGSYFHSCTSACVSAFRSSLLPDR